MDRRTIMLGACVLVGLSVAALGVEHPPQGLIWPGAGGTSFTADPLLLDDGAGNQTYLAQGGADGQVSVGTTDGGTDGQATLRTLMGDAAATLTIQPGATRALILNDQAGNPFINISGSQTSVQSGGLRLQGVNLDGQNQAQFRLRDDSSTGGMDLASDADIYWSSTTSYSGAKNAGIGPVSSSLVTVHDAAAGDGTDVGTGALVQLRQVLTITDGVAAWSSTTTGSLVTNEGATGTVTVGLTADPPPGTTCTWVRTASQAFQIDPAAGDHIEYTGGTMDDGEYLALGSDGASVTLVYIGSNTWVTTSEQGTLTEETP